MDKTLGDFIHEEIIKRGISASEFAHMVGVSAPVMNKFLNYGKTDTYGCQHHKTDTTKRDFVCPQASGTKAVKEPVIKEWFNKHYLQPLVNGSDLASLLPDETNEDELAMLEADAEETRDKLATLTQRLASVNASAARVVTERMNTLGTQLETTEKRIEEIKANYRAINRRQLRTARNVSFNYEAFWNRPAHMIQRDVRDLLGDYRFTLRDGDVIGLTHTG